MWRFILFFPVIINGIILANFLLCIKEDSIMFNLNNGNDDDSLKLI